MPYPRLTKCMPDEGRPNPFHFAHKALRFGHCRILAELGTQDFTQEQAAAQLQARLDHLLDLGHAVAIAQRQALGPLLTGAAAAATPPHWEDMAGLTTAMAEIRSLMRALKVATTARRAAAGHTLYRCYALFAAADLARMDAAETVLLATLHQLFSDERLGAAAAEALHRLAPQDLESLLRLMLPALATAELEALLDQLRATLAPERFATLFEAMVRPLLASNSAAAA